MEPPFKSGVILKNFCQQVGAVNFDRHNRHADARADLGGRRVIEEHIPTVAQHIGGNEHTLPEIPAFQLCGQILAGDEASDRYAVAEKIITDFHHFTTQIIAHCPRFVNEFCKRRSGRLCRSRW